MIAEAPPLPAGLAMVPLEAIQPCPIQPRVNVDLKLIARLSRSMREGRHQPVIEVEPLPGQIGRYQIVCGEQRWRAARAAGLTQVLVRVHNQLDYLERLERQYEENRLRANLDAVEEAQLLVLAKCLRDAAVAERLLRDAGIPFQPLADRLITSRQEFGDHLDRLKTLLVHHRVHVVRTAAGDLLPGPLSPWRETERALSISESTRKAKVGILRLDPDILKQVRGLPAEHAIQVSRLDRREQQSELASRARELSHHQVRAAVERLRGNTDLTVEAALGDPELRSAEDATGRLGFHHQLVTLADLCRQLLRLLHNLRPRLSSDERREVAAVLADLQRSIADLDEEVP